MRDEQIFALVKTESEISLRGETGVFPSISNRGAAPGSPPDYRLTAFEWIVFTACSQRARTGLRSIGKEI